MATVLCTDDPRLDYVISSGDAKADLRALKQEYTDIDRLDYNVAPNVPLSFASITSVEEGAEWYINNTRFPEEICEMMARYQFGDRPTPEKKDKESDATFSIKQEQTEVRFD